jgi:hypothetical protein
MPLTSKISLSVQANYQVALDLATGSVPLLKTYETVLQTGVGAGQADKTFHDTRTLAPSASEDLDLAGVLLDAFGSTLTVVKLKAIIIAAAAANVNNVLVGGVAAGVRPGATFAMFAGQADATGYAVTATTADLLHVANSGAGTSVTYDVIMIGTSA